MEDENTAETAAKAQEGDGDSAGTVTHHCVKRDYRLRHDGVQEVIETFPEEEPPGVDVSSHLMKINEEEVNASHWSSVSTQSPLTHRGPLAKQSHHFQLLASLKCGYYCLYYN